MKAIVRRLQLAITESCDSRCVYCNFWRLTQPRALPVTRMEQFLSLLDMTNGDLVALTGGEPTEHPDLIAYVNLINDVLGIKPLLSTNCLNIDRLERILSCCGHSLAYISTSLDGIGCAHDRNRGVEGAYARVQRARELAASNGLKMRFAITVTPANLSEVETLLSMIPEEDLDIKCMETSPFYYGDNSGRQLRQVSLEDSVYRILRCYYVARGKPNNLYNFYNALYRRHGFRPTCTVATDELFVMPNGDVCGCHHKSPLCNVFTIENARTLIEMQQSFRQTNGTCKACFSRCAAGDLVFRCAHYERIATKIIDRWRLGEDSPEIEYANEIGAHPT